jgi:hypothetical protein
MVFPVRATMVVLRLALKVVVVVVVPLRMASTVLMMMVAMVAMALTSIRCGVKRAVWVRTLAACTGLLAVVAVVTVTVLAE